MRNISFLLLLLICTGGVSQNTYLWKITSSGSDKVSYLFGTHHLFGESFLESLPAVKSVISGSEVVITETKMDSEWLRAYYAARPGSDTLKKILSPKDYDYLQEIIQSFGGKGDIAKLTPGELYIGLFNLYAQYKCPVFDRKKKYHLDEYIQVLARGQNKVSYYLESDSFQIEQIKRLSGLYTWKFFGENAPKILRSYRKDKPSEQLCREANKYASYKAEYNLDSSCRLRNREYTEQILTNRNNQWINKLVSQVEQSKCFIAVGLWHLYYECGLISQFRKLGYLVEPVAME